MVPKASSFATVEFSAGLSTIVGSMKKPSPSFMDPPAKNLMPSNLDVLNNC